MAQVKEKLRPFKISWVEMSGGFDCEAYVQADSLSNAIKTFYQGFWKGHKKSLKEIPKTNLVKWQRKEYPYTYFEDLEETYTPKAIEKMNIKFHFKQKN